MKRVQPYYDLDSPVYLFGVPTVLFLTELATAVVLIFLFKASVILTLIGIVLFHLGIAFLYKWSPNWIEKCLFYISLPYTKVYKDNISFVPDEKDFN